jgi:Protein of unknown function (DUF2860)
MNPSKKMFVLFITIMLLFVSPALAIEPIPEESGFSGYLSVGAGYSHVKSNMISGNKLSNVGNRTVDSLADNPDSNSSGGANFNFNLRYTFASTRTQLFIGNSMEDALRYDMATQLGVAQELPGNNLVAASLLFSSIPTEVWKDPYVTNAKRARTDRTSNGVRLAWDRIFGSELQLQYSYRDIAIDDEYSGLFSGFTPAQQQLLDREGDYHKAEILYRFYFDGKKHAIIPSVAYNNYDLDGDAMSNDGVDFQLTYRYKHERYSLVANGFIGYADYDKRNPIYGKTRDDDRYGIGLMGLYHNPFGWRVPFFKSTSLYVKTGYFESDSNIDFYDTEIFTAGAGLFFRF